MPPMRDHTQPLVSGDPVKAAVNAAVGGDLVVEIQAAEHINRSVRTLQMWRYRGEGPPYIKAGKAVRYSIRDLDAWLLEHRVEPRKAA